MALQFTASCLQDSLSLFRYYQRLGEQAFAQLDDSQLTAVLDPEMNSVAQIVKHMAGNMRSRWTGFPDADGEKPDRNRDSIDRRGPLSATPTSRFPRTASDATPGTPAPRLRICGERGAVPGARVHHLFLGAGPWPAAPAIPLLMCRQ